MSKTNGTAVPRCDFVLLFDVRNGNPNGDPDAGNAPRIDPETGHGLVSDVCLKRKVRNYVTLRQNGDGKPAKGYDIYVAERAILNQQHERAYEALKLNSERPKDGDEEKARQWMCQTFFDVRMFGAVMSTGVNAGQVRGPVQFTFARSIDPIVSLEQSITRMAVTTEEEAKKQGERQSGQRRTMGRKEIIPYALYRCHGFINPFLAAQTGFSAVDLDLLWESLARMFELDRSAARGEMATQKLFVFEHDSPLGSAPAHKLLDRVKVNRKNEAIPSRSFDDYEVKLFEPAPKGVTLREVL
ncbi:MAG: type I-C CRISPR-associated protein Cas7/Csd2 [Phycisphaerales bacterium]|nr:type I-C CRISPR-associated protein Cas7/Csd2 [Phycisphaerales bacterium]MCI0631507.1 type I-C CRISPR-associated protein Cas7/Csd2 [Phycisphaerales bacterium]MCI0676146.1 type I-C CRISPR-associated protein Cas7/Csd2 [Phycisphaerales bacterium]